MKKTVTLVCVLLTSEAAYSNMNRCESAMSTVVQKVHIQFLEDWFENNEMEK